MLSLPTIIKNNMKYPIFTLKKGKDRALIHRHPWLFSGAIEHNDNAKEGDIVEIQSIDKKILAHGHYQPKNHIRVKLFSFENESKDFDAAFWNNKLENALALRKTVINSIHTTGYRFVHAEGDFLPGLVVDIYAETASVQIRSKGMEVNRDLIANFLAEKLDCKHVYWKKEEKSGEWLKGNQAETVFKENNLAFYVDVVQGQKTGFFLDQRDNRAMVGLFAKDKTVLNAFSYTGGFSVYALAGGAKSVVSVDISQSASDLCEKNIALNFPNAENHTAITTDCFQYLKQMPENEFDCIILDPPAFSKSLATVDNAARGYKEINLKALQKIKSGGILFTFSCSQHISTELFQKIIFGAAADARRNVRILAHLSQGKDHPIDICHPEGEYLKGLMLWVE